MVSDNEISVKPNESKQKNKEKESYVESVIVHYGDSCEVNTLRYKDYNDYIKYSEKNKSCRDFQKSIMIL